jgi:cytochrome c oxidase assembly factor CtaG/putative copper export protein
MSSRTAVAAPRPGDRRPDPGRARRLAACAAAGIACGVVVLALVLRFGGADTVPALTGLPSPGPLTQWGLPLLRWILDLAGMATVGILLAVGVLLPPDRQAVSASSLRLIRLAAPVAAGWAAAAALSIAFTLSDFTGLSLAGSLNPRYLASFVTQIDQGAVLALQTGIAAAIALTAPWVLRRAGACLLCLLALTGVVLPGLAGHSGAANDHMLAESSLTVHVVAASLWVGGVIALGVIAGHGPKALAVAVPRFSQLALWCLIAVGLSGVANAGVRLGSGAALFGSAYGRLVLGKAAALVLLAGFGAWHRARTVPVLVQTRAWLGFARVAAAEAVLMVATVALAVGLSRSPTPVPESGSADALTPARELLGYPMPAPPSVVRLLFDLRVDGFMLAAALLSGALYLTGVRVLHRRGDVWPRGRTAAWLAGLAVLVAATNSGLGRYAPVLFSAHMVQHMTLNMVVPILLVLGAPLTLALRGLVPAARGGVGARELLLAALHSRAVRILTQPVVAAVVFVTSLYGLYFSSLFPAAMSSHWGHIAMQVHFLVAGSLFFWVLVGVDPGPRRPPHLARIGLLFLVMAAHAFFGVVIMSSSTVLAGSYFAGLHRPWGATPLADQHLGGAIGWAFGEVPTVAVIVVLFMSWIRSDAREADRADRRADRDGDAQLTAYNARLAAIAARDAQPAQQPAGQQQDSQQQNRRSS